MKQTMKILAPTQGQPGVTLRRRIILEGYRGYIFKLNQVQTRGSEAKAGAPYTNAGGEKREKINKGIQNIGRNPIIDDQAESQRLPASTRVKYVEIGDQANASFNTGQYRGSWGSEANTGREKNKMRI